MQQFRFKSGEVLAANDERLEAALAAAYAAKYRPLCTCVDDGEPMYIANVGDAYIIKRMPNSGHKHSPECSSFDPPAELSGLGEVAGSAIQEDLASGTTTLRLDYSLSKRPGRAPAEPSDEPADTVRTDGFKLTLRGTAHYLWEQADLHRWPPVDGGKHDWSWVHRRLRMAMEHKVSKKEALADLVLVPEAWTPDRKDDIRRRLNGRIARLHVQGKGKQLMVILGELKEAPEPARYGFRAFIKHLPDMPLKVAADLEDRLQRRFEPELVLWESDESVHMMLIGTFSLDAAGYPALEEASLIVVDSHWLPVDHRWDLDLTRHLIATRRRFTKCLRYNLAANRPIANVVLLDTAGGPTALYVVPPSAKPELVAATEELAQSSDFPAWIWHAGGDDMPDLPPRSDRPAPPVAAPAHQPEYSE